MTITPLLVAGLLAAGPAPKKIAVMDLESAGVDPNLAQAAGMVLPTEIRSRLPDVQVISSGEIKSLLGLEASKQALGCEDQSCMAEIGGALGVDELVSGKIGKVGKTLVIELRRSDVRASRTLTSSVRTVRGEEDALIMGLQEMVGELYPGTVSRAIREVKQAKDEKKPGFFGGKAAAWTGAGLGLVLVGGGGWLMADAQRVAKDYEAQQDGLQTAATVTRAQADAAWTKYWGSVGAMGVGAIIGGWGVYRIVHLNKAPPPVAVLPMPGGLAVSFGGSF